MYNVLGCGWFLGSLLCLVNFEMNSSSHLPPIWNVTSLPFVGTFFSFMVGFSCLF
jgi:hypothetical protein